MKKLLLSLVAAASVFTMAAETITFDFVSNDYGMERSSSTYLANGFVIKNAPASITLSKNNSGSAGWRLWTDGLRATKTVVGVMNFSVENANITKIEAAIVNNATNISANGETAVNVPKDKTYTWTGNEETVEFIFTQTGSTSVASIVITYEEKATDGKEPAGLSFSETDFNLYADEIDSFEAPTFNNPNNLEGISFESSDVTIATVDAEGNVTLTGETGETKISAVFEGNDEFSAQTVAYTITVNPALPAPASIAETLELASATQIKVAYDLTVGFVNYSNVFACDANGDFIQVYGSNTYKVGDIIPAGWVASYELYKNITPELMPVGTLPEGVAGTFTAPVVAAEDLSVAHVNYVAMIEDVEFDEDTPSTRANFYGTSNGTDLTFYNNYTLASQTAGTYNVTIVVTVYNNAPSLYAAGYSIYAPKVSKHEGEEITDGIISIVGSTPLKLMLEGHHPDHKIFWKHEVENSDVETLADSDDNDGFIEHDGEPIKLTQAGKFSYYAEYNGLTSEVKTLTVSVTSGIEDITIDAAAPAEYYNLQGIRVNAPAEGNIYIVRQGSKTAKVAF